MNAKRVRALSIRTIPLLAGLFLMLIQTTVVLAQTTITGTVSGFEDGTPLSGASVAIQGTTTRTATNLNGQYAIAASPNDVLVFSLAGYATQEITVGQNNVIDVVMTRIVELPGLTVIGSRGRPRSNVDRPVPVDILTVPELNATNQIDLAQSLHYAAPSFSAHKFGINDLAPLIDPASLRGLSPDQTLLLINGKRRHKVSFFSLNHGVGKGQVGNDINSVPMAAIKRVEILRDGAAAQYGSDAIAGVVNFQLNDSRSGGSIRTYTGTSYSYPKFDDIGSNSDLSGDKIYGDDHISDGTTFSTSINFGLPWGPTGFINTTAWVHHNEAYDRSGVYTHSAGWYPDDPSLTPAENQAEDERLRRLNGIDLDRSVLGGAENRNGGIFINAGRAIDENWDFYLFGGGSQKKVTGGIFSRAAARDDRSVLAIFPNGFNPVTPAEMSDWQVVAGTRGNMGQGWDLDVSVGYSGNNLDLFNENTVNPSLGAASPTNFYTGSLNVDQIIFDADASKLFGNTTVAFGTEVRFESFTQTPGQAESWTVGPDAGAGGKDIGSTGREGFSDLTRGEFNRNNFGLYAEVESDVTEAFLVGVAARFEDYSDFGSDVSYKLASRYRFSPKFSLRGSINRSFRAPALAQYEYSNFINIAFDNFGDAVVSPVLPIRNALVQDAFGITELEPETSFDIALGITSELTDELSLTVDVYQIKIDDRIVHSGGINADDFPVFDGSGYDEIIIFANALNTTTKGLDIVLNYGKFFDDDNKLDMVLAANFNDTEVDEINTPPGFGDADIIDDRDITFITDGYPQSKIIGSIGYRFGKTSLLTRVTHFGEVQDSREIDPATDEPQVFGSKAVTDLSVTRYLAPQISITAGVNNLFDVYPDMLISPNVRGEVIYSRRTNQFGTQGRFLNFSMNYMW